MGALLDRRENIRKRQEELVDKPRLNPGAQRERLALRKEKQSIEHRLNRLQSDMTEDAASQRTSSLHDARANADDDTVSPAAAQALLSVIRAEVQELAKPAAVVAAPPPTTPVKSQERVTADAMPPLQTPDPRVEHILRLLEALDANLRQAAADDARVAQVSRALPVSASSDLTVEEKRLAWRVDVTNNVVVTLGTATTLGITVYALLAKRPWFPRRRRVTPTSDAEHQDPSKD